MKHRNWWIVGSGPPPRWLIEQNDFMVFSDETGVWFQTTNLDNPQAVSISNGQEIVLTDEGIWLFDGKEVDPR